MMLPVLGLATIVALQIAILSKRVSPSGGAGRLPGSRPSLRGFGLQTGHFILAGIQTIAPVVGMFVFAILYFGIVPTPGSWSP